MHQLNGISFYNFKPPNKASQINQQIMFIQTRFLGIIFSFYIDKKDMPLLGPLQNPVGANTGPNIDSVAPTTLMVHLHACAFFSALIFDGFLNASW